MADIKDRAREYLRRQTQLNGGGLFHHNILNLILGFAEQETKDLEETINGLREQLVLRYDLEDKIAELKVESDFYNKERGNYKALFLKATLKNNKAKEHIENLLYYVKQCTCERSNYAEIEKDIKEAEQFLKEE